MALVTAITKGENCTRCFNLLSIEKNAGVIEIMERKIIKKNILGIISYLALEALFLKGISHIDFDRLEFIDVFNITGAVVLIVLVLKAILFPYMVIENGSISILRDYLYKENFSIKDIAKLNIGTNPFSRSNFELKNNKRIKFDSFAISSENLNYLKKVCIV
jgi:hypothetical protein